jgi:D-alanine-D-alanine ligase
MTQGARGTPMQNSFDIQTAKVAVMMGGDSAERDISLMSGKAVLHALTAKGVNAHAFDPSHTALEQIRIQEFTHVFIALHGRHGEDGTIQGALELMAIPYTGSGVLASAIAMDKHMTKQIWTSKGLATPHSVYLKPHEQTSARIKQIIDEIELPLIVKPPREGSSIGITKVERAGDLERAVKEAIKFDPELLCESFIEGPEVTCPIIGAGPSAACLPVIRIVAPGGAYDYNNKYFTDDVKYHCPSGLSHSLEKEIQELALNAYLALGCRGWGRADLMIRERDSKPFLLEMNTSPGMTSHSLVPMSAKAVGISFEDLCLNILTNATTDANNSRQSLSLKDVTTVESAA